ncbi:hypothetical protein BC739_001693 [Kutzneria viridogrisea]|uniref:XRE family transcriptional regulator n=1 Tax=Kutzneria viridogrisea TaxID=47990 RepID=A0ABR6BCA8_9PSEU|nr:hypothetical protein [Kutzneria viridogrisea]
MVEPNDHLKQARERVESPRSTGQPLSRQELAELVNAWVYDNTKPPRVIEISANYIGKLERRKISWPQDPDVRSGLRAVLGAKTDAELGLRRPRRARSTVADVDRQQFIKAALGVTAAAVGRQRGLAELVAPTQPTPVPSVVGLTHVDEVRAAAQVFSSMDARYGGGLIREAVRAQLRYCVELLNAACSEQVRAEMFSAVGYLAHVAGFMLFDAYSHDDARKIFRFALQCAEEGQDWHLRAKILSSMARQEIWCGDPDAGLTFIELAMVRSDRLTSTERAMLHTGRARALAKLHRIQETATAVGVADDEFSQSRPENESVYVRYYDQWQHLGDTGHALWDSAMDGHFVSEARHRLATAVDGHGAEFVRARTISQIKLASLVMATGDPHEAVAIGWDALDAAGALRSRRAADDLRDLRQFGDRHRKETDVAELCQRIGSAVVIT